MATKWSESRQDRSELAPCTICAAVDGPCADDGLEHAGRRWAIGITWPGGGLGRHEVTLGGNCQATVEDLHLHGVDDDRHVLLYRGACVGCGWASDRHHERNSNLAIEDALDHVLPDWRRVPIVERLHYDASDKRRERWLLDVEALYAAHGLDERYAPGSGGVIRTLRTGCGIRSHWNSRGFYDLCGGTLDEFERVEPAEQMELF